MAPLRILHVAPYAPEAWAYGGIPRLLGPLVHGLAARGHHVTLCTTDVRDAQTRLRNARGGSRLRAWTTTEAGLETRVFPNLSNLAAYHLQAFAPVGLAAYLRAHARDFDVAHVHACRNLPGAIAAHYLHRHDVPYVLAPNGTAPLIERRRWLKRTFDVVAGRRVVERATRVVAVSQAERHTLHTLGVSADRVRVIPNPIDLAEFAVPRSRGAFRRALGLEGPVVVFLGKITPRKGVDTLVRAVAALGRPDVTLVVAGNDMGGGAMAARLAETLGIGARTVFTGLLEGRARLEALADADVVAYAGSHEVFGLVPVEAVLCGTPVVVADDSGCADVVRLCGAGLVVPPRDHHALAAGLATILADGDHWRTAAARGAARARSAYGAAHVCDAVERLYREIAA